MRQRRTTGVGRAGELDGAPASSTARARCSRFAGELGRPGAELEEVEPGELRRVRDCLPQRDRPLEMRAGLRQPEERLRPAGRVDRFRERLGRAAGGGPVGCDSAGPAASAARERLGELRVQFLALAGQDRPVDRSARSACRNGSAGRLVRDQDSWSTARRSEARTSPPAPPLPPEAARPDASPGGRGHAQEALVRGSSRPTRWSSRSRSPCGSASGPLPPRRAPRRRRGYPPNERRSVRQRCRQRRFGDAAAAPSRGALERPEVDGVAGPGADASASRRCRPAGVGSSAR